MPNLEFERFYMENHLESLEDDCTTNPDYWECECIDATCIKVKYLLLECPICNAIENEVADARVKDIDLVYTQTAQEEIYVESRKRDVASCKGLFCDCRVD